MIIIVDYTKCAILTAYTLGMSWSTKHIKAHLDTRHCLSLDNYKDIYVDTSDPEPASEKDYQALEVTTKDARISKVGVAIPEMVYSETNIVLNNVTALSPTSLSPIRPVSVSISRMDKSIVDQHLEVGSKFIYKQLNTVLISLLLRL